MNISAKITDFTKMSANFAKVKLGKLFAEIRKNVQTSANVEFGAVQKCANVADVEQLRICK